MESKTVAKPPSFDSNSCREDLNLKRPERTRKSFPPPNRLLGSVKKGGALLTDGFQIIPNDVEFQVRSKKLQSEAVFPFEISP